MSGEAARRLRSMRHLSPSVPAMAFALDRDGRLAMVQANPAMAQRFAPWKNRGRVLEDFGLPDSDRLMRTLARVLKGESVELRLVAEDTVLDVRAWPTYNRESQIAGAFGMAVARGPAGDVNLLSDHDSERLRDLLDHIEDGYYEVDLHGRFLLINDALARLLGLPRETVLSDEWSYTDIWNSGNVAQVQAAFNQAYRTKMPVQAVDGQVRWPDGSERFIELSISPILTSRGRVTGFRGIVRDVTERQRADEDVARRMTLLAVLEQVDTELGQTLDVEQVLTISTNAMMLLSHADAAEIVLRDERTDVFGMAHHVGIEQPVELLPQTMGIVGRVLRELKPVLTPDVSADPDYYAVRPGTRAQMTLPLLAHGRLLGVISLETDDPRRFTEEVFEFSGLLTARVAAAIENARLYQLAQSQLAELRGLYDQVSALEQIKTDMIRIASHDLRSPLGVIVGYLELLRSDLDPVMNAEQRGFLDAMKRAADRMQRLTTDILSLERVQTVRMQTHVRLHLEQVVRRAVEEFQDNAARKGVTLECDLTSERVPIVGDPISLHEAIGNLIGNAIKYTPAGGTVSVRLTREKKAVELTVKDNGIGISEADQDKLFYPFYRVKTLETQGIEGTGLGLYLVKRIIEQHMGTMVFESKHGVGSTFGFRLPLFATSALEAAPAKNG